MDAEHVVVAVGVMPFAYVPPRPAEQLGESISPATGIEDAGHYSGKRVADETEREVDHTLIACGYRFDLDRLSFLSPGLRAGIATRNGWPVIDRFLSLERSGIFFVGYTAEHRLGPLSRFVLGAGFTANRVASSLT